MIPNRLWKVETLEAGAKSRGAREILGGPGPKQGGAGAPRAPPAAPPLVPPTCLLKIAQS